MTNALSERLIKAEPITGLAEQIAREAGDALFLTAHEEQVTRDLEYLQLPPANWPATRLGPDGQALTDVVIIGSGMYGIAAAAALILKGVRNIVVLDRSPAGFEGPWTTYARMPTLRSPKQLPGPALGIPSLTFRAWYEAKFGLDAWESLYKIPNGIWVDYLSWLKHVLHLPVRNECEVARLVPSQAWVDVELSNGDTLRARRVVVATGRPGAGGAFIPDIIDRSLWPDRAAHTSEQIDFRSLKGRTIAVLGAGASAWDNAATALEAGANEVVMYARRHALPQINKGRAAAHPGFFEGWAALDAADKWATLVYLHDVQAPPPHETIHRTMCHRNFSLRLGSRIERIQRAGAGVAIEHQTSVDKADFLIVGTGFTVDLACEPLFTDVISHIALWADRYTPPEHLVRPQLSLHPWLGDGFEFVERSAGSCPALGRIHLFNHGAVASLGAISSDVPGLNAGAERLASRIAQHLFREDISEIHQTLEDWSEHELIGTPVYVP